jgi:glutathione S-transferase
MWILKSADASPFVRKVKIGAALCGLADRIRIEATDTRSPDDPIRGINPLGKIPTLVLEDGKALFDSRVILEFFDVEAGGGVIIPGPGRARFDALTLQALADGIMDAGVICVYEERWRPPEARQKPWLDHQQGKIDRALAAFEASPPAVSAKPHVGQIALACALGYLDLRFAGAWRTNHPRLVAWLADFDRAVPSFAATRPQ